MKKTYVLFPSHTEGLALEKILKTKNIDYTIVPTPRSLSTCCGISIMIHPTDKKVVEKIITLHKQIKVEGIHTLERKRRNWFK